MKDNPAEYRGRVKADWIDYFWKKIAPEHFPAMIRKYVVRVKKTEGVGWNGIDLEFHDGTKLHMRLEAVLRVRATLWKWRRGRKRRLKTYHPALVWWTGDSKRMCRPDRFFQSGKRRRS